MAEREVRSNRSNGRTNLEVGFYRIHDPRPMVSYSYELYFWPDRPGGEVNSSIQSMLIMQSESTRSWYPLLTWVWSSERAMSGKNETLICLSKDRDDGSGGSCGRRHLNRAVRYRG